MGSQSMSVQLAVENIALPQDHTKHRQHPSHVPHCFSVCQLVFIGTSPGFRCSSDNILLALYAAHLLMGMPLPPRSPESIWDRTHSRREAGWGSIAPGFVSLFLWTQPPQGSISVLLGVSQPLWGCATSSKLAPIIHNRSHSAPL